MNCQAADQRILCGHGMKSLPQTTKATRRQDKPPEKKKNKAKPQTTSHVKRLNGFRHNRAENYYFFLSNREIKLCFELNSIDPERKWLGNPNEA